MDIPHISDDFNFGDFKKLMDKNFGNKFKIKKTVPIKPEFKAMFDKAIKSADTIKKLEEELMAYRKEIWAKIEIDMADFKTDKHYNPETNEIYILEDEDKNDENERKDIVSPYTLL